jgi:hypothetical protein
MYTSLISDTLWLVARVAMSRREFERLMKLPGIGMDRFVKPAFKVTLDAPVPRLAQLTMPPFDRAFVGVGVAERRVGIPSPLG